ncbi:hypothetical protein GUJ93_ZPchr0013g33921 [Zizania palustris]|uniref:Uncharacterized protein n=1 Tax=Zizania palustris TaxID=103762 RepID=A0A8J5X1F1_ZIZPA|nr:hypothetical protein GUJ93_ZPchr0013g33921 [Zizania palustris]
MEEAEVRLWEFFAVKTGINNEEYPKAYCLVNPRLEPETSTVLVEHLVKTMETTLGEAMKAKKKSAKEINFDNCHDGAEALLKMVYDGPSCTDLPKMNS